MKHILSYLRPYYKAMIIGLIIKILGTFADLGLPRVLAYMLDYVVPEGNIGKVFLWGGVMIVLAVLARQLNIIANRRASRVAADTTQRLRHDLYEKINTLSGAQMDKFTVPSLISRMTTDTYNIHQMIGMMQRLGVRAPIILIGGICITATMEPVLTLVLVAVIPFLVVVVFGITRKTVPMFKKVQDKLDTMVTVLRENITGIRVIKALSKTNYERKRFRQVNDDLIDAELRASATMAASSPLMNVFLNLGLTAVVIVGAYRVNSGASEPGNIVAFLSYFTMILNSVLMVNRIFLNFTKSSASAARLSEVLTAEPDLVVIPEENQPDSVQQAENQSVDTQEKEHQQVDVLSVDNPLMDCQPEHIAFEDVKFRYHQTGELCLDGISFALKKGESLGIIGPTGCGKTTIINLLMRFYDTESGRIRIDGRDVRSIPMKELRERFGVVFQNDMIFADTVRENISFARDLTQEEIEAAAADACAQGFIEILGEGTEENRYDYKAAIKGANLSGGQKQRLLIARAFAAKPEILILDDASSALDYKTDAKLRKALKEYYAESTIILVAQRISSVMSCDHIMVMEEGRIIGYGTHDELLENCEVYKEIYVSQMAS